MLNICVFSIEVDLKLTTETDKYEIAYDSTPFFFDNV